MSNTNLLKKQLAQSSTQKTLNFEYGVLESEIRSFVQERTNEIKMLMRRNTQDIINIGQKLIEVKKHLGHGNFRNWLRVEFNWSVSAATKFMQVAEQFKSVNFMHLNVTASTLYLIAAPSTPVEARVEVLERANNGENINYTQAKRIVSQHKESKKVAVELKASELKLKELVNAIEPAYFETEAVFFAQKDLTEKEPHTEMLAQSLPLTVVYESKLLAATIIKDIPDDTRQTVINLSNFVTISQNTSDAAIASMAINITNLTPEQLAMAVTQAAKNGLSKSHLLAIITASQQALDTHSAMSRI